VELDLRGVQQPELVFGLVGALGSPMGKVVDLLTSKLGEVGYDAEEIRLSDFLDAYELPTVRPEVSDSPYVRYSRLMSRGNELRELLGRGDALAMHAAVKIYNRRAESGSRALERRSFILRQLKHPEEVRLLRQIYGEGFHLIGVYTPEKVRSEYLRNALEMSSKDAAELLQRDAGEEVAFGQQVTRTFHLADLFIAVMGYDDENIRHAGREIDRYIDLLFGRRIVTPTVDEYGMFLAHAAALRSGDLSRQVGAAILADTGEVISLGTNEVPCAGGGQYWGGEADDRDFVRGYDANEKMKYECLREVLESLQGDEWRGLSAQEQQGRVFDLAAKLANSRLMNLTEFGRAVHAEMEAILSAARLGVSVRGKSLFVTTFPCHNCAKHIVGSGLRRVVYIEPYAKSLADRLHGDAIAFSLGEEYREGEGGQHPRRIPFEPFCGVAPRRFSDLFGMVERDGTRIKRKVRGGEVRRDPTGLRTMISPLTHVDREAMVADFLNRTMTRLTKLAREGDDEAGRQE